MEMLQVISLILSILGSGISLLTIIFVILTYSKNNKKDDVKKQKEDDRSLTDIKVSLAKIQTDLVYIREKIDKNDLKSEDHEKRIRKLESNARSK